MERLSDSSESTHVSHSPSTSSEYFSTCEDGPLSHEGRSSDGDSFIVISPPLSNISQDSPIPDISWPVSAASTAPTTPFPEGQLSPQFPIDDDPMTGSVPPQPIIIKDVSGQPLYQIPVPQHFPNDNVESAAFNHAGRVKPTIDLESPEGFEKTGIAQMVTEATLPMATAIAAPVVATPVLGAVADAALTAQAVGSGITNLNDLAHTSKDIIDGARDLARLADAAARSAEASRASARAPHPPQVEYGIDVAVLLEPGRTSAPPPITPEPPRRGPTRQVSEASTYVKLGDNSIITTGITTDLACDIPVTTSTPSFANFCRYFIPKLSAMRDNIAFNGEAHQVVTQSILYSCEIGGRLGPGVEVNHPIFVSFPAPIPVAERSTLTIKAGVSRKLGSIDPSLLTPYMNGGVVSERFVVSAIQPKLGMANVNGARLLSEYLTSSVEYCDNYLMYAKMLYQAMVLDIIVAMGLPIAVDPFPAGDDPVFVNLDDPNLPYSAIATPIVRGDIMFVENIDYTPQELQIITWLAKPGTRASAAGNAQIPQCCYVSWPAIPVTVLQHGAAPALPVAADLTANAIFAFVSRLATARGEWGAAIRGLYLAMDQLGVSYNHDARDGARWHFLTSYLSYHSPTIPRPRDYNVLLRILQIKPNIDLDAQEEVSTLMAAAPTKRVQIYATYTQSLTALGTTIIYDYNLTVNHLTQWGQGVAAMPAAARAVLQNYSQANVHNLREANYLTQLKNLFPVFYGCSVPSQLYPGSDWLGVYGASLDCAVAFIGQALNQPPKMGNPLVVDNWLLVRPMEWGISGPNTSLDISKEIIDVGAPENRGWRSLRGSSKYEERALSSCPVKMVVYGIQVLNAINNEFRWQGEHQPHFSAANWSPGMGIEWNPPINMAAWTPMIIGALHAYEPCSIMSYRYDLDQIIAPALVGANALNAPALRRLYNWRGHDQPQVGFYVSSSFENSPQPSFMATMNFSAMFGHMTLGATPDSEATSPTPSNPT